VTADEIAALVATGEVADLIAPFDPSRGRSVEREVNV